MDAKEVMRLAIQNRFWIAIGIAALLTMIGPLITLGSINEQISTKTTEIEGAKSGVQKYTSGNLPNAQYADYTTKRISMVTDDVNTAWRRLYDRQAPLLDWPPNVEADFKKWGRKYPEDESANYIQSVAVDYTRGYDDFLDKVYSTFRPWDPVEGTGIVVAPPKETLLGKEVFDANEPPTLTKIWQIQDNLWVRRSILDVVAKVNEKAGAKDWDTAPVKQINSLEVGNVIALDHETAAKGEALKAPEPFAAEKAAEPAAGASPNAAAIAQGGKGGGDMQDQMSAMASMGAGGGSGGAGKSAVLEYIQPAGVDQYRIYPAMISVLIDQNYLQNFLVEFENSPMSIQVKEVNWNRPRQRVVKPEKGAAIAGLGSMGAYGAMGMGGGIMGGRGGADMDMMSSMFGQSAGAGMSGYGTNAGQMMAGMRGAMTSAGAGRGRGGRGVNVGPSLPERGKSSRLDEVKKGEAEKNKKDEEKKDEPNKAEMFDPYYNVVELQVYTQARFYEPPPPVEPKPEAETPASPGQEAAAEGEPAAPAEGEPAAEGEAKPAEGQPAAEGEAKPAAEGEGEPAEGAAETPAPADAAPAAETKPAEGGDTPAAEPAPPAEGAPAADPPAAPASEPTGEPAASPAPGNA